jgi:hypothetical protein
LLTYNSTKRSWISLGEDRSCSKGCSHLIQRSVRVSLARRKDCVSNARCPHHSAPHRSADSILGEDLFQRSVLTIQRNVRALFRRGLELFQRAAPSFQRTAVRGFTSRRDLSTQRSASPFNATLGALPRRGLELPNAPPLAGSAHWHLRIHFGDI